MKASEAKFDALADTIDTLLNGKIGDHVSALYDEPPERIEYVVLLFREGQSHNPAVFFSNCRSRADLIAALTMAGDKIEQMIDELMVGIATS